MFGYLAYCVVGLLAMISLLTWGFWRAKRKRFSLEKGFDRVLWLLALIIPVIFLSLDVGQYFCFIKTYKTDSCENNNADCESNDGESQDAAIVKNDKLETEFVKSQYTTAVAEIKQRNTDEHTLFTFKFTLLGAIFAVLFTYFIGPKKPNTSSSENQIEDQRWLSLAKSPLAAIICWTAVCTAVAIDIRISYNASFISSLGDWVKKIEFVILSNPKEIGWEHTIQSSCLRGSNLYPIVRLGTSFLTFILYCLVAFVFGLQSTAYGKVNLTLQNRILLVSVHRFFGVAFFLMLLIYSISLHVENPWWCIHCGIWTLIGILGTVLFTIFRNAPPILEKE